MVAVRIGTLLIGLGTFSLILIGWFAPSPLLAALRRSMHVMGGFGELKPEPLPVKLPCSFDGPGRHARQQAVAEFALILRTYDEEDPGQLVKPLAHCEHDRTVKVSKCMRAMDREKAKNYTKA